MSPALTALSVRRESLVMQAALQREVLVQQLQPLRAPLVLVDQGIAVLGVIRAHPIWVIGGALVLGSLRPGRVGLWLQRALLATQLVARLRLG